MDFSNIQLFWRLTIITTIIKSYHNNYLKNGDHLSLESRMVVWSTMPHSACSYLATISYVAYCLHYGFVSLISFRHFRENSDKHHYAVWERLSSTAMWDTERVGCLEVFDNVILYAGESVKDIWTHLIHVLKVNMIAWLEIQKQWS